MDDAMAHCPFGQETVLSQRTAKEVVGAVDSGWREIDCLPAIDHGGTHRLGRASAHQQLPQRAVTVTLTFANYWFS